MATDSALKFTRQSSWETLSAAAHRELVPAQFASQLQHLAYNDKYVVHLDFGAVGKPPVPPAAPCRANPDQTMTPPPAT